ncbi:hypothetical protein SAMN05444354_11625 [Stigmatella aurantiaca]|uniref:Uncharacterized protein n=1 Tax=Stigmatella aurantiaca TaxID=41 RepID=A0A1H7Y0S4_STIAU|nr:hypothetical protein [Stigmatella aurantiaca]SEM39525.1 hypothetical protein SAMN05444354_11625 [Stigmatella aurantiaca]
MKTKLMGMMWLALAAACGGAVQEEEALGEQSPALVQQAPDEESIAGGGPCGTNYCNKGTFCCNSACGVCAPVGGGCLDVMCDN